MKDPHDERTVELLLPREQVQRSLLLQFEKGLLAHKNQHRNKRTAKWLKPRLEYANPKILEHEEAGFQGSRRLAVCGITRT